MVRLPWMCVWLMALATLLVVSDVLAYDCPLGLCATKDYQTQLRREIAERARLLRESKKDGDDGRYRYIGSSSSRTSRSSRSDKKDGDKYNPFGIDPNNPFGQGLDFATQAWDNAAQGDYGLFSTRQGRNGKKRQPASQPLDLNGRPLTPIQVSRLRPPPTKQPEPTDAEKEAKKEAEAAASKEETDRAIQAAQLVFDNGEYGAARRMLLPIAASRRRSQEEVDQAKKFIERIDTEGMKRLVEADETATNGDLDAAATAYNEIARKFGSAPAAKLARNKLAVLRANPEVASKYLLDTAKAYARKRRLDIAMPMLREIVNRYAKTQHAKEAADLLKELEKMAAADGALSPEQSLAARKWLIIGNIHALNGRSDKAIESYQTVIQDFEDSRYAQMAREKIAGLKKQE